MKEDPFWEYKPKKTELKGSPDPHCKSCHGRGYVQCIVGNAIETEPCHCLRSRR